MPIADNLLTIQRRIIARLPVLSICQDQQPAAQMKNATH